MDTNTLQQAIKLTSHIMHCHYTYHRPEEVLSHMAAEVTWIGPGEQEKASSYDELEQYIMQAIEHIPCCELSNIDLQAVDCGEALCLVMGSLTIRSREEDQLILEVNQRISFLYQLWNGQLKVKHMHLSNPYSEMLEGEYFPKEIGTQSHQYMQRLLQEKNEVINMISSNINGGLKGSNNDEMFSYFYVNDGLPQMLGYTYEEFMDKTGGTAVGAVYPPDLVAALKDVENCFAKGPVYSTEYRMEKKDGSLIWVIDSGRKVLYGDEGEKINSIIMDVTELKNALFNLEVERERYRIALENITDVMCEYDLEKDLYITFEPVIREGKSELEKRCLPQFSQAVRSTNSIHPADVDKLLDVLRGSTSEPVDIRTGMVRPGDKWRWSQVRCSIIYDNNRKPIKTIGMIKDVTDDKRKEIELINTAKRDGLTGLLNQTAIRVAVQQYLDMCLKNHQLCGALLIIDLDHFKSVNDTMGHLFGDKVLIETAGILKRSIRAADYIGRVGGDEFLVMLKEIDKGIAIERAEKIIQEVRKTSIHQTMAISCSIGIAMFSSPAPSFDQLFHRADQALYQAKNDGRMRWHLNNDHE